MRLSQLPLILALALWNAPAGSARAGSVNAPASGASRAPRRLRGRARRAGNSSAARSSPGRRGRSRATRPGRTAARRSYQARRRLPRRRGLRRGAGRTSSPWACPTSRSSASGSGPGTCDRLGVRIVDDTGQCHQKSVDLPAGAEDGWREVVLKVRDLVGGEHWGGANDGAWHGPAEGARPQHRQGRARRRRRAAGRPSGSTTCAAVAVAPGRPTLRSCTIAPASCRPGYGTRITYAWDAEPLGSNCSVFVHFVNAKGQMVFQADHDPPVPTSRWSGRGRIRPDGRRADRRPAGPLRRRGRPLGPQPGRARRRPPAVPGRRRAWPPCPATPAGSGRWRSRPTPRCRSSRPRR